MEGTLASDVTVALTHKEKLEYARCAGDIYYFIETHLNLKLREYQRKWIEHFQDNRFTIYCTSRCVGYHTIMSAIYLWYCTFNTDKCVAVVSNVCDTSVVFKSHVWNYYKMVPYHLKPGVVHNNSKVLGLSNGCSIRCSYRTKTMAIGHRIDVLQYLDFAHVPDRVARENYRSAFPAVSSCKDSRVVIQSTPNGAGFFEELVFDSDRPAGDPEKNIYMSVRTYWYEVEGRDLEWKRQTIKEIGAEELFDQEYGLQFKSKK
jgi:hypothetical protein